MAPTPTPLTLAEVLALFPDRTGPDAKGEYRAPCPVHHSDDPNMAFREKEGRLVFTCHSHHCKSEDIYRTVLALCGKTPARNGAAPGWREVAAYDYHDRHGALLFQVVRKERAGQKTFRQRRPVPATGAWIYSLDGITPILYREAEVVQAIADGTAIYIVEGEKDVETLRQHGLVATCNPMGAGKWRETYSETLRGARCILLPDNDAPGRQHMQAVAQSLQGIATEIRVCTLPDLPDKGDVTDWLQAHRVDELKAQVQATPLWPPPAAATTVWDQCETLADFLASRIEMPEGLAQELVFAGGITSIAAPSGVGKTIAVIILAYALGRGGVFRGERLQAARVLFLDTDNPRSLLQYRMGQICQETNIALKILSREKAPKLLDAATWDALPAAAYDVVILDSFGGATPGISEKEGKQLQQALDTLRRLADRGPAVIVLDNTNKTALTYRGRGEKTERVDAFYEVRDVTNWTPPQAEYWWEHLPSGDDTAWQQRASRRTQQDKIRLAFVCRKFRWGEEPTPFVVEIDFTTTPWTLHDITAAIEESGAAAETADRAAQQAKLRDAALALSAALRDRPADAPLGKTEAVDFLLATGLQRAHTRNLLEAYDALVHPEEGRWELRPIPGGKRKIGVYSCSDTSLGGKLTLPRKVASDNDIKTPEACRPHQATTASFDPSHMLVNPQPADRGKLAEDFFRLAREPETAPESPHQAPDGPSADRQHTYTDGNDAEMPSPEACRPHEYSSASFGHSENGENTTTSGYLEACRYMGSGRQASGIVITNNDVGVRDGTESLPSKTPQREAPECPRCHSTELSRWT